MDNRQPFSWPEFKEYIASISNGDLFFRGQADAGWGLQPSLLRFEDGPSIDDYFDSILPEAARYLAGYADYNFELQNHDDRNILLGLLQHHGFPTPLLDWTRSPYIAAFFAFYDHAFRQPECDHVAVWVLGGNWVREYLTQKDGDCKFEYVLPDSRWNKRLLAQDGLFTLSKSDESLDAYLNHAADRLKHPGILSKLEITTWKARIALEELRLLGLHPGMLFPGIDGTCASMKMKHFMKTDYVPGRTDREALASARKSLKVND